MKRLTFALLSWVMLFCFAMGTAWAQDKPTAPTFDPAAGAVPSGTVVHLTNGYESEATPKPIYFNYKADPSNFTNIKTKTELDKASTGSALFRKVNLYDPATGIEIITAKNVFAATADIDAAGNVTWSDIVTAAYTIAVVDPVAPVFSPDGGEVGDDNNTVTLTMSKADEAAYCDIYYVVNGTGHEFNVSSASGLPFNEPGQEGVLILYQDPIKITKNQTIHAAVVRTEEEDEYMNAPLVWSEVVKKEFTFTGTPVAEKPTQPVISPANDARVKIGQMVTIRCETEGVTIRYTTNGEDPTAESTVYTEPFALTEDMLIEQKILGRDDAVVGVVYALKINAVAFKDGVMSNIAGVGLNVSPNNPVFTPDGSEEVDANSTMTITCVPSQAKIYYTLDGTTPDDEGSNAMLYTGPIKLTETGTTVKARAILGQYAGSVTAATFTFKEGTVPEIAAPAFSVAAGEVEKGTEVTITCATTGVYIMYTLDGSTPTLASSVYQKPIVIEKSLTLKAAAFFQGKSSAVTEAAYTVKEATGTVAVPTFDPVAGEVEKDTKVTIACVTEGAKIYYTVDGSEPTAESAEYKEAVVIDKDLTLKAIAIKGDAKSAVAEAAYTVKVANEEVELAGVNVYPNPNGGAFSLDLPVPATVEVFASNGVLRERINAGAGVLSLSLDRSGIYFLRITGEGRTTVKRIVVR